MLDGASLHYLSPGHHQSHLSLLSLLSPPNALQPLIHATQCAELLIPNVIDRDHVFVPSGWDSWGKIRVLRDGFDVEGVCEGWSVDLASVLAKTDTKDEEEADKNQTVGGALEVYEDTISDPKRVYPLSFMGNCSYRI
jgi:dynein light intermediate chain 1, cytosolic